VCICASLLCLPTLTAGVTSLCRNVLVLQLSVDGTRPQLVDRLHLACASTGLCTKASVPSASPGAGSPVPFQRSPPLSPPLSSSPSPSLSPMLSPRGSVLNIVECSCAAADVACHPLVCECGDSCCNANGAYVFDAAYVKRFRVDVLHGSAGGVDVAAGAGGGESATGVDGVDSDD
jgi:hypothetical protein